MIAAPKIPYPTKLYAPLNRCAYCSLTQDLSKEHIIPLGLGGDLILPSCSFVAPMALQPMPATQASRRVSLIVQESPSWQLRVGTPASTIANDMFGYSGFEEHVARPVRRLEIGTPCPTLIIALGSEFRVSPISADPRLPVKACWLARQHHPSLSSTAGTVSLRSSGSKRLRPMRVGWGVNPN